MAKDLGVRKKRRLTLGQKLAIGGFVVLALAFTGWIYSGSYLKDREAALTRAREFAIDGPPCRELTRAQFEAAGLTAPKATLYENVTFHRRFGHLSCSALRYGAGWGQALYPVCQFTSPRALKVSTKAGDRYFDIAPGQPATVAVPRGDVRCVLGGNFTIRRLVAED